MGQDFRRLIQRGYVVGGRKDAENLARTRANALATWSIGGKDATTGEDLTTADIEQIRAEEYARIIQEEGYPAGPVVSGRTITETTIAVEVEGGDRASHRNLRELLLRVVESLAKGHGLELTEFTPKTSTREGA